MIENTTLNLTTYASSDRDPCLSGVITVNTTIAIPKSINEQKFHYSKRDDVHVDILLAEMAFLKRSYKDTTIHQYAAFRYGLLPHQYKKSTLDRLDTKTAVLYLLEQMTEEGTQRCLVLASQLRFDFLKVLKNTAVQPDSKSSGLIYYDYEKAQEVIFKVKPGKTFKGSLSSPSLNKTEFVKLIQSVIPKKYYREYCNFIFSGDSEKELTTRNIKDIYRVTDDQEFYHPEIAHALAVLTPLAAKLCRSTKAHPDQSKFKEEGTVYSEINRSISNQVFEDYLRSSIRVQQYCNEDIDPCSIATVSTAPEIKGLFFPTFKFLKELKTSGNMFSSHYEDKELPFQKHLESIKGSTRYYLAKYMKAFPISVWEDYFGEINYVVSRSTILLQPLALNDEINICKLRNAVKLSQSHRIKSSEDAYSVIHPVSQVLVSAFIQKKMTWEHPSPTRVTRFIPDEVIRVIHWPTIQVITNNKYPGILSTIPSRALAYIAGHFEYATHKSHYHSKIDSRIHPDVKCHHPSDTFLIISKKDTQEIVRRNRFKNPSINEWSPEFHKWLKKQFKARGETEVLIPSGFLRTEMVLERDVYTKETKEKIKNHNDKVKSMHKEIKEMEAESYVIQKELNEAFEASKKDPTEENFYKYRKAQEKKAELLQNIQTLKIKCSAISTTAAKKYKQNNAEKKILSTNAMDDVIVSSMLYGFLNNNHPGIHDINPTDFKFYSGKYVHDRFAAAFYRFTKPIIEQRSQETPDYQAITQVINELYTPISNTIEATLMLSGGFSKFEEVYMDATSMDLSETEVKIRLLEVVSSIGKPSQEYQREMTQIIASDYRLLDEVMDSLTEVIEDMERFQLPNDVKEENFSLRGSYAGLVKNFIENRRFKSKNDMESIFNTHNQSPSPNILVQLGKTQTEYLAEYNKFTRKNRRLCN